MEQDVELQDGELILQPVKTLGRTFRPVADPDEIHLDEIRVQPVNIRVVKALQPQISKVPWNPRPGRNLGFLVLQGDNLIGEICFSSPVFIQTPRDEHLGLPLGNPEGEPSERKGQELRHYADMSGCVGMQPWAWRCNGGKLLAMLATTLGDYWEKEYGDELKGVVTTSWYGKSIQYDRVYDHLGYTKGHGSYHVPDEKYDEMKEWLDKRQIEVPENYSNPKMKTIEIYAQESGDDDFYTDHGEERGVYYHDARPPEKRRDVIQEWWERWGKRRWERKKDEEPPYNNGLTSEQAPIRWGKPIHVEGAKSPPQHETDRFF